MTRPLSGNVFSVCLFSVLTLCEAGGPGRNMANPYSIFMCCAPVWVACVGYLWLGKCMWTGHGSRGWPQSWSGWGGIARGPPNHQLEGRLDHLGLSLEAAGRATLADPVDRWGCRHRVGGYWAGWS